MVSNKKQLEEFYSLVKQFNEVQVNAVEILKDLWGVDIPITNRKWVKWRVNLIKDGLNKTVNNVTIKPHGYGLKMIALDFIIDFDFGVNGEFDGFDAVRLSTFITDNGLETKFSNVTTIQRIIDTEVKRGNLKYSGYINYYLNTETGELKK